MQQRNDRLDPIKIQINVCPFFIYEPIDSVNKIFGQIGVFEFRDRLKFKWYITKWSAQIWADHIITNSTKQFYLTIGLTLYPWPIVFNQHHEPIVS